MPIFPRRPPDCHGMQVCSAYRNSGGASVVVLSSRPKIDMEETFRRIIPEEKRFNTQFVFRSGSPLVPGDLRRVAASAAASVIIVADTSRSLSCVSVRIVCLTVKPPACRQIQMQILPCGGAFELQPLQAQQRLARLEICQCMRGSSISINRVLRPLTGVPRRVTPSPCERLSS